MSRFKTAAALAALAAGAAAAAFLSKKKTPAEAAKPAAEEVKAPAQPVAPANAREGAYSFVAGYSKALNSEVKLCYDADKFSFDVVEDDSLTDTNVSHVALMHSEKVDIQLEYAEFYPGEGMEELKKSAAERYSDYEVLSFGENSFLKYTDGDCICLIKGVDGSEESYIVISVFKTQDNDDKLAKLLTYPEMISMLASVKTETL